MNSIEEAVAGQFRMEFCKVEKIGFGILVPIREPVSYEVMLPSTWPILPLKLGSDDASSDGIKYTKVLVATTATLSAADRKSLAAELKAVEAARATRTHQKAAGTHADTLAEAIEKLSASIRSQPISVSVRQETVDVRLVDVHPDLMRRAAGDNEEPASKTGQPGRKERPQRKNPAGRPTMKAYIFRLQLERWAAGQTEKSCASEAREIERLLNQQFQSRPKPGVPPVPHWDSIENMIRHRYRRLQNTRNTIKYLMGIRPN